MKPEIISSELLYSGKIFDLSLVQVKEKGIIYSREIINHPGSVVIVPVFADKRIALVRQYRQPAQKYLLELPAGSLNKNEDLTTGARRELAEEIGVTAENLEKLTEFYVSPGFLSEKMFVFLATDLTDVGQNLEEDEFLQIEKITFSEAFEMILNGEIEDAKTINGIILAAVRLGINFQ